VYITWKKIALVLKFKGLIKGDILGVYIWLDFWSHFEGPDFQVEKVFFKVNIFHSIIIPIILCIIMCKFGATSWKRFETNRKWKSKLFETEKTSNVLIKKKSRIIFFRLFFYPFVWAFNKVWPFDPTTSQLREHECEARYYTKVIDLICFTLWKVIV